MKKTFYVCFFMCFLIASNGLSQESYVDIKEVNGITYLCKTNEGRAGGDDSLFGRRKGIRLQILNSLLNKLNTINTFKTTDINDEDLCNISTSVIEDWDSEFKTKLNEQDNYFILQLSPTGECGENALAIAIVDYKNKAEVECECKKMYSFFKNGGLRGPFTGHMTCYEQEGILIMIEFLFNPETKLLNLFDNVSLYK